ncbi:DUF4407 domain-containing protein (plasmid) [Gordonia rubripertincta]|uniref:DUF4407 domain-containing protein n=1 Tax=Gordonia rubripertincta TaxID=36822 RepID=UPI0039B5912C
MTRFVLAAAVAVLMSIGIELVFFKSEIDQQVRINNALEQRAEEKRFQEDLRSAKNEAEESYRQQLDAPANMATDLAATVRKLEIQQKTDNKVYACEAQPLTQTGCESGSGVTGADGDEAREAARALAATNESLRAAREAEKAYTVDLIDAPFKAEELKVCGYAATDRLTRKQADTCTATLLVDAKIKTLVPPPGASESVDGPIRRLAALSSLGAGEHGTTVWATRILLLLVVASIDLVPLSAKLFGGATGHDIRARIDNIAATTEYVKRLKTEERPEPRHLHEEPRDGFHFLGVGRGYRHESAIIREAYHLDRLRDQVDRHKSRWSGPGGPASPTKVYTETATDKDDDASSDTHRNATSPSTTFGTNHVLQTADGAQYLVHSKIAQTRWYELWSCRRSDEYGGGLYAAKVCSVIDGDDALNSALTGLNRDVMAAGVRSEHVIEIVSGPVVQQDDSTGLRYVIMPYFERGDLLQYAKNAWGAPRDRPPLNELLNIIRQIILGLRDTHQQGILHLDMKPQNVLIDGSGRFAKAVITDFGIAAVIQELENREVTSGFSGTATYAPIEQLLPGTRHGRRAPVSDLWAVGAITFRMLLNAHPRQFAEADANLPMVEKAGHLIPDRGSEEYAAWLDTAPTPPRLDAIDPAVPGPVADLIERWLENDQKHRVSPGVDISRRGRADVMTDALAQLDATIEAIR